MEEILTRAQYPSILTSCQPAQASNIFGERLNRITKTNSDIAKWLEERRKVEELYAQGLHKLVRMAPPDNSSELGIFTGPWAKIVSSLETIAQSHHIFATRLESDIVSSLQSFTTQNSEMSGLSTIKNNMDSMINELDTTQKAVDKLAKKGGKANTTKVDQANQKYKISRQEWEAQAPFIFERLQAVDESRLNHLRDVLTQYLTHEADLSERCRVSAEGSLNALLEVDTDVEIKNFVSNITRGTSKGEQSRSNFSRTMSSASSMTQSNTAAQVVPTGLGADDVSSLHSARNDGSNGMEFQARPITSQFVSFDQISAPEQRANSVTHIDSKVSKGLQRFGTMLKNRRQSMQSSPGFNRAPSPSKGLGSFTRTAGLRDARLSPSPRASSTNLRDVANNDNRLTTLAETSPVAATAFDTTNSSGTRTLNDVDNTLSRTIHDTTSSASSPQNVLVSTSDGQQAQLPQMATDSEGFSVPAARDDPISQVEDASAIDSFDQSPAFKLNIKNEPIREEDADAQAALSSVSNTLRSSTLVPPTRRVGTVRGRREVRNTMYIPPPELSDIRHDTAIPVSPTTASAHVAVNGNRTAALAALSNQEHNASDAGSIRSSRSLASGATTGLNRHPELTMAGLASSVIETVSASFNNGEPNNCSVIGEVALAYGGSETGALMTRSTAIIRLENFSALEAIAPNHSFIAEDSAQPGRYQIDLNQIAKTSVAFRYKLHNDSTVLAKRLPIFVKPAWKPQGDKLGLVVEYGLSSGFSSESIKLSNLMLLVSYQGEQAQSCQTKPAGTHIKDKRLIYWRIGDITLAPNVLYRVIARLSGGEELQPQAGVVEARWELTEASERNTALSISTLEADKVGETDPFADSGSASGENWSPMQGFRRMVSGRYEAH